MHVVSMWVHTSGSGLWIAHTSGHHHSHIVCLYGALCWENYCLRSVIYFQQQQNVVDVFAFVDVENRRRCLRTARCFIYAYAEALVEWRSRKKQKNGGKVKRRTVNRWINAWELGVDRDVKPDCDHLQWCAMQNFQFSNQAYVSVFLSARTAFIWSSVFCIKINPDRNHAVPGVLYS